MRRGFQGGEEGVPEGCDSGEEGVWRYDPPEWGGGGSSGWGMTQPG